MLLRVLLLQLVLVLVLVLMLMLVLVLMLALVLALLLTLLLAFVLLLSFRVRVHYLISTTQDVIDEQHTLGWFIEPHAVENLFPSVGVLLATAS